MRQANGNELIKQLQYHKTVKLGFLRPSVSVDNYLISVTCRVPECIYSDSGVIQSESEIVWGKGRLENIIEFSANDRMKAVELAKYFELAIKNAGGREPHQ
ncbi:hypothetical protein ACI7BZ_01035 [Xanthobacter sp. AM11]|uniref:hypothetical protein n=1 Tax=Xanthobacter sp. AM11 TaxID=3380643 RepID=UPI0039BF66DE